jgi:hypothetical protein
VRALLQTASAVLALCARGGLSEADMALQTAGFASHARLLGRMLGTDATL